MTVYNLLGMFLTEITHVIVKKIERYLVDNTYILLQDADKTLDAFDITILFSSAKILKCILHPSFNYLIYKGLIKVQSVIRINKLEIRIDETNLDLNKTIILRDVEVFEYTFDKASISNMDVRLQIPEYNSDRPLSTSRNLYQHLYNDEDHYGAVWLIHNKQMKVTDKSSLSFTTIHDLHLNRNQKLLPLIGKIVTKSRISSFGKKTDSLSYPFLFSMEIEDRGWSCSITIWSKACLSYFKLLEVGQTIVVQNYRIKNRYGLRTNTVYGISKPASFELSINPGKGDIDYIDESDNSLMYEFKTCKVISLSQVQPESVCDVIGCIMFVGRIEREKKKNENKCVDLSCAKFWMYRWISIKDDSCNMNVHIKLYACSQPDVITKLMIGDIFVGARMLYKFETYCYKGRQRSCNYLTTTRESQLYAISKDWTLSDIKQHPFYMYCEVLDICKCYVSLTSSIENLYEGYFVYPPLPDTLKEYESSFAVSSPMVVSSTEQLIQMCKQLHIYQSMRVCVQATIVAVEIVEKVQTDSDKRRSLYGTLFSNEMELDLSQNNYPYKIIDKETLELCDSMETIGDTNLDEAQMTSLLGKRLVSRFTRLILVGLNKNVAILASFISKVVGNTTNISLVDGLKGYSVSTNVFAHPETFLNKTVGMKDERFLFVLDLYCQGNNEIQVVINRGFKL